MSTIKELTGRPEDRGVTLGVPHRSFEREASLTPQELGRYRFESLLLSGLRRWSIPMLRVGLGLVFLWFGALKLSGSSPVAALVRQTFPFLPFEPFFVALGVGEVMIGCGLICKRALRCTLALLLLHMAGTFIASWQAPSFFFLNGNPFLLTMEGEFLVKNVVLVAASLVIGGYEVKPRRTGYQPVLPSSESRSDENVARDVP